MVVEVVASRVIARHLGSSLYTWTSVIGIVLLGITLGNLLGGRLAELWPMIDLLGMVRQLGVTPPGVPGVPAPAGAN